MSGSKDQSRPVSPRAKSSAKKQTKKALQATIDEVRLTRRLLVGWLVAAGSAGAAVAQGLPKASAKVTGIDIGKTALPLDSLKATRRPVYNFNKISDLSEFALIRPEDMLILNIRLVNMKVTGKGAGRHIQRTTAGKTAIMVVEHQPQAIAESTFPDKSAPAMPKISKTGVASTPESSALPVIGKGDTAQSFMSGNSRIAYLMPDDLTTLPFTVTDILDACARWKLNLDWRASDAPSAAVMPSAHKFDKIAQRLNLIANAQKAALHGYGNGSGSVEALLSRAADKVVEAISSAAGAGKTLSNAAIDALIKYEIKATLTPEKLDDPEIKYQILDYSGTLTPGMTAFVSTLATEKLVIEVIKPIYQMEGLEINPAILAALKPGPIPENATDLEVPFRLHMSPLATAGFSHARDVVDHGGPFAELWHTRLGTRVSDWVISENAEPLRALYADDLIKEYPDLPHGAKMPTSPAWALSALDRTDMVKLMSDFSVAKSGKYVSRPAMAKHLRLTALGASLDAEGIWPDHAAADTDLVQWKHITSIGRDQYVRVIYDGVLFPFGHGASLIKVSERKFTRQTDGGRVAGLMQKYFIIVRQRVRDYPGDSQRFGGRDFPFTSVEITTKQTPDMQAPVAISYLATQGYYTPNTPDTWFQTFWPQLMNPPPGTPATDQDVMFDLVGIDSTGRRTAFKMPLIFVAGTRNDKSDVASNITSTSDAMVAGHSAIEAVALYYNSIAPAKNRTVAVSNSLIRFSQNVDTSGNPLGDGESDYHASEIVFRSWKALGNIKGPRFYPTVASANIEVPSVKSLLGVSTNPKVLYHSKYLKNGFSGANPAQLVFGFDPVDLPNQTTKPTDKFGGLLSPNLAPDGLSRKLGAITGIDQYLGDAPFNPIAAFGKMELLGIVSLGDIITQTLNLSDAQGIPKLKTVTGPDSIVTTYEIKQPTVKSAGDFFVALPWSGGDADPQLQITSTILVHKAGGDPQASVEARLNAFRINLFGFITLNFKSLSLKVRPGSKTDCDPVLDPETGVVFGGPLEFMNSFRKLIPMDGFADPPGLDITPAGITASYSLGLPDIGVGAMTLQNVNLGAGFDLPFTGLGPSARFNFAERHNPFNLTVSLFGGGGFFAIALDTGGVRELEASLEFGAQISIDLGVASGGIYVKGGFYFHWIGAPADKQMVMFEGYVEMGGHLSVLGLISVSLVFHLGLAFEKTPGHTRLYGTATLTVEIDILFFSISQSITVERQFAGSDADPSFALFAPLDSDTGKPVIWNSYCEAFA